MHAPDPDDTRHWVKRVNHAWFVRGGLKESADEWLDYLSKIDVDRLQLSCESAHRMCRKRTPDEDPKPWFYAGLFRYATAYEAQRFLSTHYVTLVSLPCMAGNPEAESWLAEVGEETRELVCRLRQALAGYA